MRRHARVDVLSIVTFNYWFRERDANKQILFIDIHKCSVYNDRTAISMPKSIVSAFNLPELSKRDSLFVVLSAFESCFVLHRKTRA